MRRLLLSLLVLLAACTHVETPPSIVRLPAVVSYDPSISRLIIPRDYNGGVWVCAEDVAGMEKPSCVPLQQFRNYVREFRNVN